MEENFFEGDSYAEGEFKGLIPKYYPEDYRNFAEEEVELLKSKLQGANKVLEAGVGIGRLIPPLAPLVKKFVGIDNAKFMVDKATDVAKDYSNAEILKGNLEDVSEDYTEDYFDYSLCMWNLLGNIKDPLTLLKDLKKVTKKSIFATVFYKGTLEKRINFYKSVDVNIVKIDKENETFFSEGHFSKAFNEKDIRNLASEAGLIVKEIRIFSGVILWAEFVKE
jgi:SAM-dependent methyltransferase